MAFPSSAGWGNLPQGNFSPVIYSKQLLNYFRKTNVAQEITNTRYEGEIKGFGDSVKIIKEPVVTVSDYTRGKKLQRQDLDDSDITLTVDQAKSFYFEVDDIEARMSHVDWKSLATGSGAYKLMEAYDANILAAIAAGATTTSGTGTNASPITLGFGAGNNFTPYDYMNRFARLLDENDIPNDGKRYFVAPPIFWEALAREDSKLIDQAVTGDPESMIRNRKLATSKEIAGFMCFKSNNMATSASGHITVLAGHREAVSTATVINKVEAGRIPGGEGFGDFCKGLLVFGRKVLRPEAVFLGHVNGTSGFADA